MWDKLGATGLDFEVEGAGQFGTVWRNDIAEGMATGVLGYTLPVPRLGTFNQLFPNAHSCLGTSTTSAFERPGSRDRYPPIRQPRVGGPPMPHSCGRQNRSMRDR